MMDKGSYKKTCQKSDGDAWRSTVASLIQVAVLLVLMGTQRIERGSLLSSRFWRSETFCHAFLLPAMTPFFTFPY